jgi:protein-L-isoaspartate(D-aspartate) O-methyltransferase
MSGLKLLSADFITSPLSDMDADGPSRKDEETVAFLLSLRSKGIRDKRLLSAFESVPRTLFADARHADLVQTNISLPIACGQTLLAPTVLARLLTLLNLSREHVVLEIGTGTGYATALLARLVQLVISFERFHTLALGAAQRLPQLNISNVELYHADGLEAGHEVEAVDRILLMGSIEDVPENLLLALKPGGKMVGVVIQEEQSRLTVIDRHESGEFSMRLEELMRLPLLIPGVAEAL